MKRSIHGLGRLAAGLGLLGLTWALAGCNREAVVEAGRTRVGPAELELHLKRRGGPAAGDAQAALEELGQRALLAEAGRKAGLEEDRIVAARIAAARRELLAQAFLDRELAAAEREDALRQRYEAQKIKLTRRRIHVAHAAFRIRAGQPGAREAAMSQATRAYARLNAGEKFEAVVKALSEDEATRDKGGDVGPLLEGEVDPAFFAAGAALAAGAFSSPIETPYGFHVLAALEAPSEVVPSFEEVRPRLAAEARAEAQERLLERLREEVGLELHPERIPATAKPSAGATKQGGT